MRIAKIFGCSAGLLLVIAVAQAEPRDYVREFREVLNDCSQRYPANAVNPKPDNELERESCYNREIKVALLESPQDGPDRLSAALQVAPEYAESTFKTALTLGVDPYQAVTRATSTLPEQESAFARLAIAHGADPNKTMEATAAGRPKQR